MNSELSERELQILLLVAQGLSNRQIAGQLDISDNTVKVHVRNIFAKINVALRTEASLYAVRHGLLIIENQPVVPIPMVESPPQLSSLAM
jgi:DNA-binding NarL/FixJ family response regulator